MEPESKILEQQSIFTDGLELFQRYLFRLGVIDGRFIPAREVFAVVRRETKEADLLAAFVFAIVVAESDLNPYAESETTRGIMQLSRRRWDNVSSSPYLEAWIWRRNIAAGVRYLTVCRHWLESKGHFSYPLLAATYRYGFDHVKKNQYDLHRIRRPRNRIYRKLFDGDPAAVEIPGQ